MCVSNQLGLQVLHNNRLFPLKNSERIRHRCGNLHHQADMCSGLVFLFD